MTEDELSARLKDISEEVRRVMHDMEITGVAFTLNGKRLAHGDVPAYVVDLARGSQPIDKEQKQVFDLLRLEGYKHLRMIPGRGVCGLGRLIFTVGIVYGLDEYGYAGRYCYHTHEEALDALEKWDGQGDPGGNWIVNKGRGEDRYNPNHKKE